MQLVRFGSVIFLHKFVSEVLTKITGKQLLIWGLKPDEKIKFYFVHFDYTQEGAFVMLYENSEILLTK